MDKIVIVGGGGHAKVIISIIRKLNKYEILGYTDFKSKGSLLGIKYLGDDEVLKEIIKKHNRCCAVIGVGSVDVSNKRKLMKHKLELLGFTLPVIVSPNCIINENVNIDKATVIFDGVVINSYSVIGECAIINTNSTIEHDCFVGNFVHIGPGAVLAGNVKIGDSSIVGASATIITSKNICSNCIIGAGAVVVSDITLSGIYGGIPAKILK